MEKVTEFSNMFEHERKAVAELVSILNHSEFSDYRLLVGYFISGGKRDGSLETDVLLICKNGLFVIELKNWYGIIEIPNLSSSKVITRHRNGSSNYPNPVNEIRGRTRLLNGVLNRDKKPNEARDPVRRAGVLLFTHPQSTLRLGPEGKESLVDGDIGIGQLRMLPELLKELRNYRKTTAPDLNSKDIENYKIKLGGTTRLRFPYTVGSYVLRRPIRPFEEEPDFEFAGYKLYEGNMDITDTPILVKEMRLDDLEILGDVDEHLKALAQASVALRKLGANHPHILEYYDHYVPVGRDAIYQSFRRYDRLEPLIRFVDADLTLKLSLLAQVADALAYVHDHGMLHRSINPYNVLVADGDQVKLFNFDLARVVGQRTRLFDASRQYRERYVADELLNARGPEDVSWQCDSFSFGVTAFELLSGGVHPFKSPDPDDRSERHDLAEYVSVSDQLLDMLDDTLSHRPTRRPPLAELKQLLLEEIDIAQAG